MLSQLKRIFKFATSRKYLLATLLDLLLLGLLGVFFVEQIHGIIIARFGLVAQWIEQLRPKEKVVRSTRARATT